MLRSQDGRGCLVALVAGSAVAVAVGICLEAFTRSVDQQELTDEHAVTTATAVAHAEASLIDPAALDELAATHAPPGLTLHVVLETDAHRWTGGPTPPPDGTTTTATRPITVDRGPGLLEPGRLSVTLWHA